MIQAVLKASFARFSAQKVVFFTGSCEKPRFSALFMRFLLALFA
jgi:hypothetical protein